MRLRSYAFVRLYTTKPGQVQNIGYPRAETYFPLHPPPAVNPFLLADRSAHRRSNKEEKMKKRTQQNHRISKSEPNHWPPTTKEDRELLLKFQQLSLEQQTDVARKTNAVMVAC